MRKITSLLMLCLMALGLTANAQTLDLTNSSNVYTVDSEKRGYLYYDEAKSTTYILSTWLECGGTESTSHPKADGSVTNNQFAFIKSTTSGKVYMYSVAAKKFLKQSGTNIVLTEEPEASVTLTAYGTYYLIAFESGDEINFTNWDGNQQGIRVAGADPDGGNKMTITLVSTSVDLSAAIEKVNPAVTPEPEPEPGISTSKEYRIKHVNSGKYMNASNYDAHASGPVGGVQFVDKAESNDQIFTFVADGTNYKLKTKSGKYIYCQSWNVDALAEGTSLTFVDNGDGTYYIKNGVKYFKVEYVSGAYYPYCDASLSAAAKFIVEEITVAPDPEVAEPIKASDFAAEKVYVIKNVSSSRSGYLYVGNDNALCIGELNDMNNAPNNYLFKAMPTNSGLVLKAVEGGYVPTGDGAGSNLSATTITEAAVVTVAAKGGTYPETTLNMLVNGHYCNVNPGKFCTWDDANDANGVWEFYAIEEIANVEAAQMTTVTGLAEQALTLDGVGYPVASERENLNNTVAAAKAFNTSGAWYEEMVNTLTAYASTNNVKMPEDGKAYTFTNVHPNATYGQRYLHYNNDGVLTATARGTATAEELPISAKFICKKLNDGRYVFVNNNGKYLVWRGKDGGTNNHSGGVDAYNNDYCPMTFVKMGLNGGNTSAAASIQDLFGFVAFGGKRNDTQNSYFLTSNNNNTIFNQDGDWTLRYSNEHSTAFKVEEVTYPNKPVVKDAAGVEGVAAISTFCAPFATVAPNNVDVYIAASDESHYIKLQKVEGAVPANTGVVLVSEDNALAGEAITMVPATTEEHADVTGNLLCGDAANGDYTVDAAVNAYVLGAVDGVAGFYPLSASDRTIKQGKAYLKLDAVLSAVKLYFGGDDATGIETVVKENANAPIFDLSGRRVVNVAKGGIYIQNGKKFIVK